MKLQKLFLTVFLLSALAIMALAGCRQAGAPPRPVRQLDQPTQEAISAAPQTEATTAATSLSINAGRRETTPTYRPGALLTNRIRNRIILIGSDGSGRSIENWTTFYALGLRREAALTVDDEALDQISISNPLTRLLFDADGYRYWAVDGDLWAIDAWQSILTSPAYHGVPATPIDPILLPSMPRVRSIPNNTLLRDGSRLYVKQGGIVYPLADVSIYSSFGYSYNQAVDAPQNALAPHDFKPALTRFLHDYSSHKIYEIVRGKRRPITLSQLNKAGYRESDARVVAYEFLQTFPLAPVTVSLRVSSPMVNLREGPGTGYPVVAQAALDEQLIPLGRAQDGSWYKVEYQNETVWVSASVVEGSGDLEQIPQSAAAVVEAASTLESVEATPTPVKPLYCDPVPIRGFGKVWADIIEIQRHLGCPRGGEQGTKAAVQRFQRGVMVWVEQDSVRGGDPVYVLFDDNTYQRFGDMRPADPAAVGATPSGFYPVGDKFSAIYWEGTGARVKERLGYAISQQSDSPGAFQQFRNGRMFWLGTIDRIFVIFNRPRIWSEHEDTF